MTNAVRAIIFKDNNLLVMKRNKFGKEYCTLIGGGVDTGESIEEALVREVREETGLLVNEFRKVFVEDAGPMYGVQHIFWCQYNGGEPVLSPDSEESKISQLGQNTYTPMWLPLDDLVNSNFLSLSVKQAILDACANGFPDEPKLLKYIHS